RRFALGAEEDRHGVCGANVERANFRDLIDDLRADPLREPREARERSEIRLVTAAHPFTMRSEAAKTRGARAKALPTARRVQAPLPNGTSLPRSIEDKARALWAEEDLDEADRRSPRHRGASASLGSTTRSMVTGRPSSPSSHLSSRRA